MSIRSILVPLTSNTERQSIALEAAIALASHRRAFLDTLYLKAEPTIAFRSAPAFSVNGGRNIAETYTALEQQINRQCDDMRARFAELCKRYGMRTADGGGRAGPSAVWRDTDVNPQADLALRGRLSDLIVVGRADPEGDRPLLELALRSTGRPVLMVPGWHGTMPGRRVAIAWNGSAEAARALAAALPFLEGAQAVTILTAESDRTAAGAAEHARLYLARHEIRAETSVFQKNIDPPVGKALLDHCRQFDADMLVMGAYTHSRAHELLLGGVTSYMAANADRAVLMMR